MRAFTLVTVELADASDAEIMRVGPNVWVSDFQFSSSIDNVVRWELVA
jgi:hypothetical protein